MLAPMTFIVTLVLIVAVVVGLLVLIRAFGTSGRQGKDIELGTETACPHCSQPNPTHAKFCGQCGKALQ